ncbi:hypothetical protein [Methylobacterium sp. NFXW15]|uniref:hypothetical protein n=1 Tax=Methylobacterium sp. NFXW15 TaxID=2819512 RepID=UPI003CF056E3
MYVCLSSASRVRYLEDVARSVSMPPGAIIRFRYATKIVDPKVLAAASTGKLHGQRTLICFLDASKMELFPSIVPTRFASIEKVEVVGGFMTLDLKLSDFPDIDENVDVQDRFGGLDREIPVPSGQSASKWERVRYFFGQIEDPKFQSSNSDHAWQRIVTKLAGSDGFKDAKYGRFFRVYGLSQDAAGHQDYRTAMSLSAGVPYYIQVSYFSPAAVENIDVLSISASSDAIKVISQSAMTLDSDYDKQTFIVQGTGPEVQTASYLNFVHEPSPSAEDKRKWKLRFELPVIAEADGLNKIIRAALAAASPAAAALLGIYAAGKLNFGYAFVVVGVYIVFGFANFMLAKQK